MTGLLSSPLLPLYPLSLSSILQPLSLRDNKPEERSSYSSWHLLPDKVSSHHRKASNATFTSSHEGHSSVDETEPDHGSSEHGMVAPETVRSDPVSTVASPTHTHVDTASDRSTPHHAKFDTGFSDNNVATSGPPLNVSSDSQESNQENGSITKVELVQDELVDPHPFKLRPFELASLLDPKSLETLLALGGVDAILEGLGFHRTRGLTMVSSSDSRSGTSQRHDRMDEHLEIP